MQAKNVLKEDQRQIAEDIYSRLDRRELFNIPTGRGKTFILMEVAVRAMRERGERVIISVPNNYLVREAAKVAMEYFGLKKEEVGIRIGNNNYISRSRLVALMEDPAAAEKYFNPEDAVSYLEKRGEGDDLFFDDFFGEVPLKDVAFDGVVRHLVSLPQSEVEPSFKPITITNHYYLLSKAVYDPSFDAGGHTVLVDEVHELADVAEQVLTESFSFFEYRNILSAMIAQIRDGDDFHGKRKALNVLQTQAARAGKALRRYSDDGLVGKYVTKGEGLRAMFAEAEKLGRSEEHHYIVKRVLPRAGERHARFFGSISSFVGDITSIQITPGKTNATYGVYYSPSRGYPTLRISNGNPLGQLHNAFWGKVERFAGVSGSCTSSLDPGPREIRYGYLRLGMLRKNENRAIHFYPRIFPRENVTVHLVTPPVERESVYANDFDPADSAYYGWVLDKIHATHDGKNAMVLCGGYREASYLAALYETKYGDARVHHANTREKADHTVARFKEEGGILFATKNYGVGLSLDGPQLEKMYILKLPYPDFTTKKWQEIQGKSMGMYHNFYQQEMRITLVQNFGRLARTPNDRGDIYLMAKLPRGSKREILPIAGEYGIVEVESSAPRPKRKNDTQIQRAKKKMEELF